MNTVYSPLDYRILTSCECLKGTPTASDDASTCNCTGAQNPFEEVVQARCASAAMDQESGMNAGCPCDVWCRGSTTCLLYVRPDFGGSILN